MSKVCKLEIDEILNKEFNIDFKGYSAPEVDAFLDTVIEDYKSLHELIAKQQELLVQYEASMSVQSKRILDLESRLSVQGNTTESTSMVDILKRLSRLEQSIQAKDES